MEILAHVNYMVKAFALFINSLTIRHMQKLSSIILPFGYGSCISSEFEAFDEMFGADGEQFGMVRGKVTTVSAAPGTGKTRLFITAGCSIGRKNPDMRIGYITDEQDVLDLRAMATKMNLQVPDNVLVVRENQWVAIRKMIESNNLDVVFIDSIPLIQFPQVQDEQSQAWRSMTVDERAGEVANFTRDSNVAMNLVNHTTKSGTFRGSNTWLHLADLDITMRKSVKGYDGIKVVEFFGGKNRNGEPVTRAFPFNGIWDLGFPLEVKTMLGSESGALNVSKIAEKKKNHREQLIALFEANNGIIEREQIDSGALSIDGLARSGMVGMLRDMVANGEAKAIHESNGKRGSNPIVSWTMELPAKVEETLPVVEQDDEKDVEDVFHLTVNVP